MVPASKAREPGTNGVLVVLTHHALFGSDREVQILGSA